MLVLARPALQDLCTAQIEALSKQGGGKRNSSERSFVSKRMQNTGVKMHVFKFKEYIMKCKISYNTLEVKKFYKQSQGIQILANHCPFCIDLFQIQLQRLNSGKPFPFLYCSKFVFLVLQAGISGQSRFNLRMHSPRWKIFNHCNGK